MCIRGQVKRINTAWQKSTELKPCERHRAATIRNECLSPSLGCNRQGLLWPSLQSRARFCGTMPLTWLSLETQGCSSELQLQLLVTKHLSIARGVCSSFATETVEAVGGHQGPVLRPHWHSLAQGGALVEVRCRLASTARGARHQISGKSATTSVTARGRPGDADAAPHEDVWLKIAGPNQPMGIILSFQWTS